jgi:hypothetical protein
MDERFSLGIEGEEWSEFFGGLLIPIIGDRYVIVRRVKDRGRIHYVVIHKERMVRTDNLLMLAALVHETIEQYRSE